VTFLSFPEVPKGPTPLHHCHSHASRGSQLG
jgi:hypothetical protein